MTHVRRGARHRKADCRRGRHDYGESQHIGAGIDRRVCKVCGAVTIDLTQADRALLAQGNALSLVPDRSDRRTDS